MRLENIATLSFTVINLNVWLLIDVGPVKFFHSCRVSCLITQVSNTHVKIQCFGQGIKLTGWET